MASWHHGLAEELALERVVAVEAEREAEQAWRARDYPRALRLRARAAAARAHITKLEAKQRDLQGGF